MTAARLAKTVAEPTAKNSFIFTILGTKWGILWLWLLIINVVAFLAYGGDKLLAKLKEHQPKVPSPGEESPAAGAGGRRCRRVAGHGAVPPQDAAPGIPHLRPPVHPDLDRCSRRAVPLLQRHQISPAYPRHLAVPVFQAVRKCVPKLKKEDSA